MRILVRHALMFVWIVFSTINPDVWAMNINLPWPSDDPAWRSAKELWEQRTEGKAITAARILEALAAKYPERHEPSAWLCRCYYYLARQANDVSLYKKAVEWGDKTLAIHPEHASVIAWSALALAHYDDPSIYKERIQKFLAVKPPACIRELPVPEPMNDEWARFLQVWDERHIPENAVKALESIKAMYQNNPEDLTAGTWLVRVLYYSGVTSSMEKQRVACHKQGSAIAETLLRKYPDDIGLLYWHIANIGRYADKKSVLTKSKYSGTVFDGMKRLESESPLYYHGAVIQYAARALNRGSWLFSGVFKKVFRSKGYTIENTQRMMSVIGWIFPNCIEIDIGRADLYIAQGKTGPAEDELKVALCKAPGNDQLHYAENMLAGPEARFKLQELTGQGE